MRAILCCLALLAVLALPASAAARESQFTIFEAPTELLSDDAGLRTQTFDEIQGLGVHWLRVVLYWHSVAPVPDDPGVPRFDETDPNAYPGFGRYDRLIGEARARGMRILLTVSGPVPRWATRDRDDTVTRPSATRFRRFMTAVIRRYGDDVDYWSIWNEPNHPDFLRPQYSRSHRPVSPGIYRGLVFAADRAFRAVGERADRMLVGETAPRGTGKVVGPLTFLRGALCLDSRYRKRRGCSELPADGWAHHAYTTAAGPFFVPPSRNDVTIGVLGRLNTALARAAPRARDPQRPGHLPHRVRRREQARPAARRELHRAGRVPLHLRAHRLPQRTRTSVLAVPDARRPRARAATASSASAASSPDCARPPVARRAPTRASDCLSSPTAGARARRCGASSGPPAEPRRVAIDYRNRGSHAWRFLKRDRTNRRGYWTTTTRQVSGRRYRVRWTDGDGTRREGPLTRSYRGR